MEQTGLRLLSTNCAPTKIVVAWDCFIEYNAVVVAVVAVEAVVVVVVAVVVIVIVVVAAMCDRIIKLSNSQKGYVDMRKITERYSIV